MTDNPIRVAVNGYGVIGKRVAGAVLLQPDMRLIGIADVTTDWRIGAATMKAIPVFGATDTSLESMIDAGFDPRGTLDDLLEQADVVVDCTPKGMGAENAGRYREAGVPFILQGGEQHDVSGHSFVAESSYDGAVHRSSTRVVSCNTTSIVRTLTALKRAGLLRQARGTLLRRATDPWESHLGGIMNTLVPEANVPSHQAPDARAVDPDLDVVTMAVKVPETLSHLHFWYVGLSRAASREEVLEAFAASTRVARIRFEDGLGSLNTVKELMLDLGRPHGDMYEVALWEDVLAVDGDEAFYAYMVDNQAIVIPESIDAIRAVTGRVTDAGESMRMTNDALGIRTYFLERARQPSTAASGAND